MHLKLSQEVTPLTITFKLENTFKEVSPLIQVATILNAPIKTNIFNSIIIRVN